MTAIPLPDLGPGVTPYWRDRLHASMRGYAEKCVAAETERLRACLRQWERLSDPATLHQNLLRGIPAQLSREALLHLAGGPQPPLDAIGQILAEVMERAVQNGANSISMPDAYVEVATWLNSCSSSAACAAAPTAPAAPQPSRPVDPLE